MMSKQSGDADEPRQPMTGGIPQRDTAEMTEQTDVGICILDLPSLTRSAPAPSTSAAV